MTVFALSVNQFTAMHFRCAWQKRSIAKRPGVAAAMCSEAKGASEVQKRNEVLILFRVDPSVPSVSEFLSRLLSDASPAISKKNAASPFPRDRGEPTA